jgi:hypothetical protein
VQCGNRAVPPKSLRVRAGNPLWYSNLKANLKVHIQIRGQRLDPTAGSSGH